MAAVNMGCRITDDVFQALKETYSSVEHKKDDKGLYHIASTILSSSPSVSILRVNTLKCNITSAEESLRCFLNSQNQPITGSEFSIEKHSTLADVLVIHEYYDEDNDDDRGGRILLHSNEVIVDELCGVAVLRGADIFRCGVLGAPSGMVKGDAVSVYADLDHKCRQGSKEEFKGQKYFLGNGIAMLSRNEIFQNRQLRGVAIKMTSQLFPHPSFHELDPEIYFPQNLPSAFVCHNLQPASGEVLLDMCAAPGGKTTHAAIMMMNKGKVIAIDKSAARVEKMQKICDQQNLSCVKCLVFDSTKLCSLNGGDPLGAETPPYRACSFDKIILDPPCSGIGQRPQLQCKLKSKELNSYPVYQRKLFSEAIKLLKPNGKLIYSTCTITIEENENQVAWALKTFTELKLISQEFYAGGTGIPGHKLDSDNCKLVQRFDPCLLSITETEKQKLTIDQDTIGFFIALFTKS